MVLKTCPAGPTLPQRLDIPPVALLMIPAGLWTQRMLIHVIYRTRSS